MASQEVVALEESRRNQDPSGHPRGEVLSIAKENGLDPYVFT